MSIPIQSVYSVHNDSITLTRPTLGVHLALLLVPLLAVIFAVHSHVLGIVRALALVYSVEAFPDFEISRVHVGNIVRDNNITLKRTKVRHEPTHRYGKAIDIRHEIDSFYRNVQRVPLDDIICIDETSLQAFMVRNYCRSPLGKRCVVKMKSWGGPPCFAQCKHRSVR